MYFVNTTVTDKDKALCFDIAKEGLLCSIPIYGVFRSLKLTHEAIDQIIHLNDEDQQHSAD